MLRHYLACVQCARIPRQFGDCPTSPPRQARTHSRTHTRIAYTPPAPPPLTTTAFPPHRLGDHACPYWATTGRWRQSTVHALANVPLQQKKQRLDTTAFRLSMEQCPIPRDSDGVPLADGVLYALYGDPGELERGGHPYWLVAVQKNPYQAPRGLKCAQGNTIAIRNWIVNAQWYSCTSDDPNHKSYELLPVPPPAGHPPNTPHPDCACGQRSPHVHVRLSSFVTEIGLDWARYQQSRMSEGVARPSTGLFSDASHLAVMRHNFSNVA